MSSEPQIVSREQQPYMAVKGLVTVRTFPQIADRLAEVIACLAAQGVEPAGAPFFKYNVIDMERTMEVEAGLPVAVEAKGNNTVFPGVLPAGRYATLTYVGNPRGLAEPTISLLAWAARKDVRWDVADIDNGQRWGSRLEILKTDPRVQPDMDKWETELAFRLAD